MKRLSIYILAFGLSALPMVSCQDFLDTIPDQRTELDTPEKVYQLLVSAYPQRYTAPLFEHRTDNVRDNGPLQNESPNLHVRENYYWQGNTEASGDNTQGVWDAYYMSIATANHALEAIEQLGNPAELQPARGEALVIRAYSHFVLANVFCQAYSAQTAAEELGIPYVTEPERNLHARYQRGTLAEVYKRIDEDLRAGLPLINDALYKVPQYRFNKQAANAFAAKFYLYYERWDEANKYATIALGSRPESLLRPIGNYKRIATGEQEWGMLYISAAEPTNLMLLATTSVWHRDLMFYGRYGHHFDTTTEATLRSRGPWGKALPAYEGSILYRTLREGSQTENQFLMKYLEIFEYINSVTGIGYPHVVAVPFSGDQVLLYRAEARVLQGDYSGAASDLALWYISKGATPQGNYTAQAISDYYLQAAEQGLASVQTLRPQFAIATGQQTAMLHAVLHARRIETVHEGQRWEDIKRYGIEVVHNVYNQPDMVLKSVDKRRAIQIPKDVITAGIQPNP